MSPDPCSGSSPLALLLVASSASAQTGDWQTPVVDGVGPAIHFPDAAVQPDTSLTYRIVFDVDESRRGRRCPARALAGGPVSQLVRAPRRRAGRARPCRRLPRRGHARRALGRGLRRARRRRQPVDRPARPAPGARRPAVRVRQLARRERLRAGRRRPRRRAGDLGDGRAHDVPAPGLRRARLLTAPRTARVSPRPAGPRPTARVVGALVQLHIGLFQEHHSRLGEVTR